jgi:CheY-like chemotaxis protein
MSTVNQSHATEEIRLGPTILVVEDDVEQRMLFTRIFVASGYFVLAAENGDEAVNIAVRELPGLIMMDATMPGKNGWVATRELKDDARTRHIPILILTGHSGDVARDAALAAGCDVYLTKPVPVRHLLAAVLKLLPQAGAP